LSRGRRTSRCPDARLVSQPLAEQQVFSPPPKSNTVSRHPRVAPERKGSAAGGGGAVEARTRMPHCPPYLSCSSTMHHNHRLTFPVLNRDYASPRSRRGDQTISFGCASSRRSSVEGSAPNRLRQVWTRQRRCFRLRDERCATRLVEISHQTRNLRDSMKSFQVCGALNKRRMPSSLTVIIRSRPVHQVMRTQGQP